MLALSDARHGGAALALAPGAKRHDLPRRDALELGLRKEGEIGVEIAGLLGRLDDAIHGATDHHELPASCPRRLGHRTDAGDVRGEGGDRDAARRGADQLFEGDGNVCLRRRDAVAHGIGRIANQRRDACLSQRPEPRLVGRSARERCLIELPIAGMEDGAERGLDHDPGRFRDRMRHGDELDVERPDGAPSAHGHHFEREALKHANLGKLRFEHRGGEGCGVDGDAAEPRPEVDHGAEMVLMGVSEQQALQVRALLLEEADVGQDDIDARLRVATEGDAQVDDQPLAVARRAIAVEIAVHADLTDAANGHEHEIRTVSGCAAGHGRFGRGLGVGEEHVARSDAALGAIGEQQPERAG